LDFFNEIVHPIPIGDILDKYKENIEILGPDLNRQMILTVIIGESLTEIYKKCFDITISELVEFIIEKRSLTPDNKKEIKQSVRSLYGQSNPDIGMIYSLGFMKFMAQKVGYIEIVEKCDQFLNKYYRFILKVV
jgi:hypothetical protein